MFLARLDPTQAWLQISRALLLNSGQDLATAESDVALASLVSGILVRHHTAQVSSLAFSRVGPDAVSIRNKLATL